MTEDKFDRLLTALPDIAKAVNEFNSEEVQEQAFGALVQALGLNGSYSTHAGAPPAASAFMSDGQMGGVDDAEGDGIGEVDEEETTTTTRRASQPLLVRRSMESRDGHRCHTGST